MLLEGKVHFQKGAVTFMRLRKLCVMMFLGVVCCAVISGVTAAWAWSPDGKPDIRTFTLTELRAPREISLGSLFEGQKRPVLVVFFMPTCPHCRDELQDIEAMMPEYEGRLTVAAITSGTYRMDRSSVWRTLKGWGVGTHVPVYLAERSGILEAFEVQGVPLSVLFDSEGKIVQFFEGRVPSETLRTALDNVLKSPE
jgi:thiol-disulfide isomerase/thioredoxin